MGPRYEIDELTHITVDDKKIIENSEDEIYSEES